MESLVKVFPEENYFFFKWLLEIVKSKACEILKIKEFTFVNNCFQDEYNAAIGIF